jgi:hypothetical protein
MGFSLVQCVSRIWGLVKNGGLVLGSSKFSLVALKTEARYNDGQK